MKKLPTKVKASKVDIDEILPEYDFSGAKPNKFAARYAAGSNVVVLEPDVAAMFPSAVEVNEALRALAGIIQKTGHPIDRAGPLRAEAPDHRRRWRLMPERFCSSICVWPDRSANSPQAVSTA